MRPLFVILTKLLRIIVERYRNRHTNPVIKLLFYSYFRSRLVSIASMYACQDA